MNDLRRGPFSASASQARSASPGRIVVVEDVFVRSFLRTALERAGYQVFCATTGEAARSLGEGKTGLLITNSPRDFAAFGSAVPLLYLSAFPDAGEASEFTHWKSLRKPFHTSELMSLVGELVQTV
jgi:DNA-binding response OmpR family regulator